MPAKKPKRLAGVTDEDWRSVDVPELSDEDFARMGGLETLPPAIRRAVGQRGPGKKARKELVKIRLDPDIVTIFRASGPGWQTRINEALRQHVSRSDRRRPEKVSGLKRKRA